MLMRWRSACCRNSKEQQSGKQKEGRRERLDTHLGPCSVSLFAVGAIEKEEKSSLELMFVFPQFLRQVKMETIGLCQSA